MNFSTQIYKKNGVTRAWLRDNGFRYNKDYSDSEYEVFSKRFPLHKYKQTTTLEGEMAIEVGSGAVAVCVVYPGTHNLYPFYYNEKYGNRNSKLLVEINNKIRDQFKKLGIKTEKKGRRRDGENS